MGSKVAELESGPCILGVRVGHPKKLMFELRCE